MSNNRPLIILPFIIVIALKRKALIWRARGLEVHHRAEAPIATEFTDVVKVVTRKNSKLIERQQSQNQNEGQILRTYWYKINRD